MRQRHAWAFVLAHGGDPARGREPAPEYGRLFGRSIEDLFAVLPRLSRSQGGHADLSPDAQLRDLAAASSAARTDCCTPVSARIRVMAIPATKMPQAMNATTPKSFRNPDIAKSPWLAHSGHLTRWRQPVTMVRLSSKQYRRISCDR